MRRSRREIQVGLFAAAALAALAGFALTASLVRAQYIAPSAMQGEPDPLFREGAALVAFPAGFEKGVRYRTLDRPDLKQYREIYATPAAVEAARQGKPLPSGTVLTLLQYKAKLDAAGEPRRDATGRFIKGDLISYMVMEKRSGWGTRYSDQIRNGEWEYQSFTAEQKPNEKAGIRACFACHKPLAGQDFVITLAKLAGKAAMPAQSETPGGPGSVVLRKFAFAPARIEAKAGQPITFVNADSSPHHIKVQAKELATRLLHEGESEALIIDSPGSYEVMCGIHPLLKGTIEVR
jgi:plastocyanin